MNKGISVLLLFTALQATSALADEQSARAAVGGGLAGALGAFLGSELGGRSGAILGSGLGAVVGSAIATEGYREGPYYARSYYDGPERRYRHRHGRRGWDD